MCFVPSAAIVRVNLNARTFFCVDKMEEFYLITIYETEIAPAENFSFPPSSAAAAIPGAN